MDESEKPGFFGDGNALNFTAHSKMEALRLAVTVAKDAAMETDEITTLAQKFYEFLTKE